MSLKSENFNYQYIICIYQLLFVPRKPRKVKNTFGAPYWKLSFQVQGV